MKAIRHPGSGERHQNTPPGRTMKPWPALPTTLVSSWGSVVRFFRRGFLLARPAKRRGGDHHGPRPISAITLVPCRFE